jgi:hypothetical protein
MTKRGFNRCTRRATYLDRSEIQRHQRELTPLVKASAWTASSSAPALADFASAAVHALTIASDQPTSR